MENRVEFLECACFSNEHTLKFMLSDDNELEEKEKQFPDNVELHTEVYLNDYRGIFKRTWTAIKYVFGYKSRYGHWDCFILRWEDADRLRTMLNEFEELRRKYEKK